MTLSNHTIKFLSSPSTTLQIMFILNKGTAAAEKGNITSKLCSLMTLANGRSSGNTSQPTLPWKLANT